MIGEAIKLIRTINGKKAVDLAKELDVSASYLSLVESGKKRPSIDLIEKFARIMDVRPSQVLFFAEELNEKENTAGMLTKLSRPALLTALRSLASLADNNEEQDNFESDK
jgi:transcriptional regulator with XRE-family HTH domain